MKNKKVNLKDSNHNLMQKKTYVYWRRAKVTVVHTHDEMCLCMKGNAKIRKLGNGGKEKKNMFSNLFNLGRKFF